MFGTAYGKKIRKLVTLYHDDNQWYLVSQYTGELVDVSFRNFIMLVKDFFTTPTL